MRALQRNDELIKEPFNQWVTNHLDWLITPRPDGDGYTLIDDYHESEEESSE